MQNLRRIYFFERKFVPKNHQRHFGSPSLVFSSSSFLSLCFFLSVLDTLQEPESFLLIQNVKGYLIERPIRMEIVVKPKLVDNDYNTAYYTHYFYNQGKFEHLDFRFTTFLSSHIFCSHQNSVFIFCVNFSCEFLILFEISVTVRQNTKTTWENTPNLVLS